MVDCLSDVSKKLCDSQYVFSPVYEHFLSKSIEEKIS